MSLQTNLAGRVRNTSLPKSHGLMPVFEAVVNSIQSIEEKGSDISDGKITLIINRFPQSHLDGIKKIVMPIIGFKIIDNGCGFNNVNYNAFQTLDTDHKIAKGCRGVGRLLWLKAFDNVKVISFFLDEQNKHKKRYFEFNANKNVYHDKLEDFDQSKFETTVILEGFNKKYSSAVASNLNSIAIQLLEHCLWYFVRSKKVPEIIVQDNHKQVNLKDLYSTYIYNDTYSEKISILEDEFDLLHIKFRASTNKKHLLSLCAANRLVKEEIINANKVPGLYNEIQDNLGPFIYTCYIASPFLDDHVRSERTSFDIPDNEVNDLLSSTEISFKLIEKKVLERTKEYLADALKNNIEAGEERLKEFVNKKSPQNKYLLRHVDKEKLNVAPHTTDKELDKYVRDLAHEAETKILEEGLSNMTLKEGETIQDYEKRMNEYISKIGDIKQADLAKYVTHRKVVIDYLRYLIGILDDGNYAREKSIHQLIMPLGTDSSDVPLNNCNLWLLDERLAFHDYLSSDKPLKSMPILETDSMKEPDLCCLQISDQPILINDSEKLPLASITIVEFKRPMRNDMNNKSDKDPIDQCLNYVELIRDGKAHTSKGRPIPKAENVPAFCYIIADITSSIEKCCKIQDFHRTADNMGFFGYKKNYNAYFEIISFDRLLNAATERNKAFFDKLGLPYN